VIVARIVKVNEQRLEIQDGTMAGRITTEKLLAAGAQAGNVYVSRPGVRPPALCESDVTFGLYRDEICKLPDVPGDPALDGTESPPCGAVSVAVAFRAIPIKRGRVFMPPRPDTCPPGFSPGRCP
jgi:hypothetical protein